MDASPSVFRSSPPPFEPRSPPTASMLAMETRDGARGLAGVPDYIPPSEAAGPLRKRLPSALPDDDKDAKRIKDVGKGGIPARILDTALSNDGQIQLARVEPESLLFSCRPVRVASNTVLGPSGSAHGVQPMSLFELDGTKHKIFLSHAGAQKDFVEQLCVDLEHKGYFFPFFDQKHHSLPKGEDFAPLIMQAARLCHVAVVVLSEEFLCSKWPMIELAMFYGAQQGARDGHGKLKLLPLFFKLSIEEVKDEGRWMPKWKEHAACDARIDLSKWSASVKALCKSNGLEFGKVARTEVAYRECVVGSIFKLCPPDLLFGSFEKVVGSNRMCEAMSTEFVEDTTIGARVLGVYGMAGLGKTMLAKALHDYLYGEFLGKVCYIDMRSGSRGGHQKKILKMLCGFDKDVLDFIGGDVEMGLMQMKTFIKQKQVFLVFDNVTHDAHLSQEVKEYLTVGFHPESQILITSSSKAILEDLLPNIGLHMPMPTLMFQEAQILFLKHAVPMRAISELTRQEQDILKICIQKCWFKSKNGGFYHPVALTALADFFSRLGRRKGNQLLVWKDHLDKEMDLVKDVLKSSKDLFIILGLQFSTFEFTEKLLFLDLALYLEGFMNPWFYPGDGIGFLYRLYDESPTIIKRQLRDLRNSGMIEFDSDDNMDDLLGCEIRVPHLYEDFAKWYAMDHNVNGLKNAYGVFQPGGVGMRGDSSIPIKSWSHLIRLRFSYTTPSNVRLIASKRMQELSNLVALYLCDCNDLRMLTLEGLHCLRVLELYELRKLETITLCGNSSKDEYVGIYDSLQDVRLYGLESLVDMPNLRPCTSLHSIFVHSFYGLRSLEGLDCPSLKDLMLRNFLPSLFESLLDFDCLQSLKRLYIDDFSADDYHDVDNFEVQWRQKLDESDVGLEATIEGEGHSVKFLKELNLLLHRSNRMSCWYISLPGSNFYFCR